MTNPFTDAEQKVLRRDLQQCVDGIKNNTSVSTCYRLTAQMLQHTTSSRNYWDGIDFKWPQFEKDVTEQEKIFDPQAIVDNPKKSRRDIAHQIVCKQYANKLWRHESHFATFVSMTMDQILHVNGCGTVDSYIPHGW